MPRFNLVLILTALAIAVWFLPVSFDLPASIQNRPLILWVSSSCSECATVKPQFEKLRRQYPTADALLVDIGEHPDWWRAFLRSGVPAARGVPYLYAGGKVADSAETVLALLPEAFDQAARGALRPPPPAFPLHRRIVVAGGLFLLLSAFLRASPRLYLPGLSPWLPPTIAALSLWMLLGQCPQCGSSPWHSAIAGMGFACYVLLCLVPSKEVGQRMAGIGGFVALALLSSQIAGLTSLCSWCIAIDLLAVLTAVSFPRPTKQPTLLLDFGPRVSGSAFAAITSVAILAVLTPFFRPGEQPAKNTGMPAPMPPRIGGPPPLIGTVKDAQGQSLNLAHYRGKWVALVWGDPLCRACAEVKADLDTVENLHTVSIVTARLIGAAPPGWYVNQSSSTAQSYGVRMNPTLTLIDASGRVAMTINGRPSTPINPIIEALRGHQAAFPLMNGYEKTPILIGRLPEEKGTIHAYLPSDTPGARERIAWARQHATARLRVYSPDPALRSLLLPGERFIQSDNAPFGRRVSKPHLFVVNARGNIAYFEQEANPFPPPKEVLP